MAPAVDVGNKDKSFRLLSVMSFENGEKETLTDKMFAWICLLRSFVVCWCIADGALVSMCLSQKVS